jgi:hypothetical protein
MQINIKPGFSYYCRHVPSGEELHAVGISPDFTRLCIAGYPPAIANFSDCTDFEEIGPLSNEELTYRKRKFGDNWL